MSTEMNEDREHVAAADCWCKPKVEYVPPRRNLRDDVGPLDEYRGQ